MQQKIFVSSSSKDAKIASSICMALEARGHRCWMSSRDVKPGENYQGAIVRAIRDAGVMVMVFSTNANNSDEIKKELALASQSRLLVIPVRAEDVLPSEDFTYELATRQWIDLFDNWERAIEQLDRLMNLAGNTRVDAALYWKSYALAKQGQRPEALNALADLMKRFADSRWLKDARALEVEVRQASGQAVSPDAQNDEELKLLALRGIMQGDPERAFPMIEKILAGSGSVKRRENALVVVSQSRSPKGRDIVAGIAKGGANPDLQLRAIRYLGAIGGPESRQLLDEVYRGTTDRATKRAAVQALMASGDTDKIIDIAKNEKDADVRRMAIRYLGSNPNAKTGEALRSIYGTDTTTDVRREVISALSRRDAGATLVELARIEKDPMLKKEIVQRLSNIKSKEATDYLLELLK